MLNIPNFDQVKRMPYTYYKRDGFRFFFKNEYHNFDIRLTGIDLYDFVDQYNIGDQITFFDEQD